MDYASDFDSQGRLVQRKRRGGFSFLIIAIGTVCLAAAWIMTATDPYSDLANRVVEVRTPPEYTEAEPEEQGPVGLAPDSTAGRDTAQSDTAPREAAESEAAAFREMISSLPSASSASARTAAPDDAAPDDAGARPPAASPAARRTGAIAPVRTGPAPMTVPVEEFAGPPQPGAPAVGEEPGGAEVELTRAQRRAVQRRLRMAGHDAGATDGVFGPNTRAAIASFQDAEGFQASGQLDAQTLALLQESTDAEYVAWAESRRSRSGSRADAGAPVSTDQRYVREDAEDCARAPDGSILENQGIGCDLRGLGHSIRGVLGASRSGGFNPTSGAER